MSDAHTVGKKLVEFCKQGKHVEAVEALYARDIVSMEPVAHPGVPQKSEGFDAVLKKNKWWTENHMVHSAEVTGPWPHGDQFIVIFKYDVTPKAGPMAGKRMQMEEAGLYAVKGGKIVKEEFFYAGA